MIKILSSAQTRELDAFTIKNEPITSIDLMERACKAFTNWFVKRFASSARVLVVCGTGNNGGDGLGIARMLSIRGNEVDVMIVRSSTKDTSDFTANLYKLPKKIRVSIVLNPSEIVLSECDVIIDALFGSGLSRPLDDLASQVVRQINESDSTVVSVDMPSGLFADLNSEGLTVHADYTICFQLPKLSFFFPQYYQSVGEWHVVDIGLSKEFIEKVECKNFLVEEGSIKGIIKTRKKFSHKGDYGHSLIIAGSIGKIGANVLATKASLRTGSGLVTALVPKCGYNIIQSAAPEAMAIIDADENFITQLPDISKFSSIGVGPGIGTTTETVKFITKLFESAKTPLVVDADAINILAEHRAIEKLIPPNSILTPHPGEFKRLVGSWSNDFDRLELLRNLAQRLKSIVILKGAFTAIAIPNGNVFFNTTGNPAMATGGSGDVLTGIITSLFSQKYSPEDAAILGVYIHGLAGDKAAENHATIIASDIIAQIPSALLSLTSF